MPTAIHSLRLDEAGSATGLSEASGARRRILIISPGQGSSGYYPEDVLERDGPKVIVAGTQMYLDHPGRSEAADRPERSVRDLAAVLTSDAVWDPQGTDGPGLYAEAQIIPTMVPMIDALADHIGVSLRGRGQADNDGKIIRLTAAESVDFVTKAGRGGKVLEIIESARLAEAMTANELRDAVWDAVRTLYADDDTSVYVQDFSVDDGWVVFEKYGNAGETYWRTHLTVDDHAVAVGGTPVQVERQVTWTANDDVTEALREALNRLEEARNVGQWFESHVHLHFTRMADEMAADGRLTRDERIALSNSIGAGLQAFNTAVADLAPHLYDRDPYDPPESQSINTEEAEVPTPEELQAQISDLQGRLSTVESERDEARTELARRRDADLVREATAAIEAAIDAVELPDGLADVAESIRERARGRVTATRDGDGRIVTDALAESARQAVQAEVDYLAKFTGPKVTGLGESSKPTGTDAELREANAKRAAGVFATN